MKSATNVAPIVRLSAGFRLAPQRGQRTLVAGTAAWQYEHLIDARIGLAPEQGTTLATYHGFVTPVNHILTAPYANLQLALTVTYRIMLYPNAAS
jgi:hypothetical protein